MVISRAVRENLRRAAFGSAVEVEVGVKMHKARVVKFVFKIYDGKIHSFASLFCRPYLQKKQRCLSQVIVRLLRTPSYASLVHVLSPYNWISLLSNRTSSPGLNAGRPMYGHPSHLNASPSAQFPQLPTFPCTVKSTSARSSASNFRELSALSAEERLAASSASIFSFIPQVQSLQARRRLPGLGWHSSAGIMLAE